MDAPERADEGASGFFTMRGIMNNIPELHNF
jgi:hypothetical protein